MSSGDVRRCSMEPWGLDEQHGTHHEGLEVRAPPLREAVSNLPLVIHTVRRIELSGVGGGRKPFVQTLLQSLNFVFAWLQVVARAVMPPWNEVRPM